MSKHHLRNNNTCQNCGHTVPERFCTFCGQENVETRRSFSHLLRHFIEDLTHYEGNFWKTIKYLLFRPAYLTQTYLAGKRSSYVLPVKLYIFISFVAFLLPGFMPHYNDAAEAAATEQLVAANRSTKPVTDTIRLTQGGNVAFQLRPNDTGITKPRYKTLAEYDSVQQRLPEGKRDGFFARQGLRAFIKLSHLNNEEIQEKLRESLTHNFPKVLFIFLPVFAFVIWIFHSKKKWLYFDHAIYTLHYFSFVLLLFTLMNLINNLIPWFLFMSPISISIATAVILWLWSVYYFYRAHRKMYQERWFMSLFKSTIIFFFNSIIFLVMLVVFVFYSIDNIH